MSKMEITSRSYLFVPGNRPDQIDKAIKTPADMIIIDLEDAVTSTEKDNARIIAAQKAKANPERRIIIRVNSFVSGLTERDVNEIVTESLFAIMLPKVESSEDIDRISSLLCETERNKELQAGSVKVIGLVESALGVQNVVEIAASKTKNKRFLTVAFGSADYTLDMGIEMTDTAEELLYPRSQIAIACRVCGLAAPIDAPYVIRMKDEEAIRLDAYRAKQLGFGGKLCIHPVQVPICNKVFSPTLAEIEQAQKMVQAYDKAHANGHGAMQFDGKMVDLPVYKRAKDILRLVKTIDS